MVINLAVGGQIPQAPLGVRGTDFPVVNKTDPAPVASSHHDVPAQGTSAYDQSASDRAEQQRYEAILTASRDFFKDVYAVSDTSFTIYKDASGQYITRYTSLRDGRVTYIPEQNILQYAQSRAYGGTAFVKIQA